MSSRLSLVLFLAPIAAAAMPDTCDPHLASYTAFVAELETRARAIDARLAEVGSPAELERLNVEVLATSQLLERRQEIVARLDLPWSPSSEIAAVAARVGEITRQVSRSNLPFRSALTEALLTTSAPELRDVSVLVEGVVARGRVSAALIEDLGRIAVTLQAQAWLPAETRAKYALKLWRGGKPIPTDWIGELPRLAPLLPEGTTRLMLLHALVKERVSSQYAQPILTAYLATRPRLTTAEFTALVNSYAQFGQKFDSAVAAKAAVAATRQGLSYDQYVALYRKLDAGISYGKSKQFVAFINTYLGLRKSDADDQRVVAIFKKAYQPLDSASARKVALACLKYGLDVDLALRQYKTIYEKTNLGSKQVPILVEAVYAAGGTDQAAARAIEVYTKVQRALPNLYTKHLAAVAAAVMKANVDTSNLATHYQSLTKAQHFYSQGDAVAMLKGLIGVGLTSQNVDLAKLRFAEFRQRGLPSLDAANWAVAAVKKAARARAPK